MKTIVTAILSIALSVGAQFALKTGMSGGGVKQILLQPYSVRTLLYVLREPHVLLGFLLYGIGAVVWLDVLAKWDVSKAYPLVGVGFAFTAAIGILVGEHVTVWRLIGILLICSGVLVVGTS